MVERITPIVEAIDVWLRQELTLSEERTDPLADYDQVRASYVSPLGSSDLVLARKKQLRFGELMKEFVDPIDFHDTQGLTAAAVYHSLKYVKQGFRQEAALTSARDGYEAARYGGLGEYNGASSISIESIVHIMFAHHKEVTSRKELALGSSRANEQIYKGAWHLNMWFREHPDKQHSILSVEDDPLSDLTRRQAAGIELAAWHIAWWAYNHDNDFDNVPMFEPTNIIMARMITLGEIRQLPEAA